MVINEQEQHIDKPKKSKTKKRKQSKIDDYDDDCDGVGVASSKKANIKGIILSVTKPSYTLKRGIGRELRSLRSEHRNRLRDLLRQLVRRQNWDEACGVLSLLLKGTHKESGYSVSNRMKYWATLELLKHMKAGKLNINTVLDVRDICLKKDFRDSKHKRSLKVAGSYADAGAKLAPGTPSLLKGRLDVELYLPLFLLSRGDTDKAKNALISLQQETDFLKDPIANLVAGLTFSHLWYNTIKKEISLHDSLESSSPIQSVMSEPHEIMLSDHSHGQSAVESQDSGFIFQPDSNTSIRIDKGVDQDKKVLMNADDGVKKEISECEEHMNSDESDKNGNSSRFLHTGKKIYGSIVDAHDLGDLLMPLKFPRTSYEDFISLQRIIQNDHYEATVKHLKNALHFTPPTRPAFEALLPLVQMLLFGDRVKEAIEEVESVVQNYHAALPFRLKASLLEHFSKEDANKLSICFEDTLRKDPSCSHSLAKLISLYHVGDYSIERLTEMIALHLDATYADCDIWKEFASCFPELSQCEEDRMSSCVNNYGDSFKKVSKYIPDMFQNENWRLRCRWWLTRHFTQSILASEVISGSLELVAYKAASACHLYGPEFAYVVMACRYFEKEKRPEMSFLKKHMENAIGLTQHYKRPWAATNM